MANALNDIIALVECCREPVIPACSELDDRVFVRIPEPVGERDEAVALRGGVGEIAQYPLIPP